MKVESGLLGMKVHEGQEDGVEEEEGNVKAVPENAIIKPNAMCTD